MELSAIGQTNMLGIQMKKDREQSKNLSLHSNCDNKQCRRAKNENKRTRRRHGVKICVV